jgi:hypothetical protein
MAGGRETEEGKRGRPRQGDAAEGRLSRRQNGEVAFPLSSAKMVD